MSDFHDNCIKIMQYAIIKISRYLKFEINWIMFAEFVKILMLVIVKKYLTLIFKF